VTHPFAPLAQALIRRSVRYVLVGVSGANLYAPSAGAKFVTRDFDLLLAPDADNLINAWAACDDASLDVWLADEPMDRPRDRWLADRVIERRAVTRVTGPGDLEVDLMLFLKGFEFDAVWNERRVFLIEGIDVPTARLLHIVQSKEAAGRDKDRLFLATHRDALEQLLKREDSD
jgi:hypothetical protein